MDILKRLASGLIPTFITRPTGLSARLVHALTYSIDTKLRCRATEQAVARAVSTGILNWTNFFADPVAELADAERQILCGGIARWSGRSLELITFEEGRTVRYLDSFQTVQVQDLTIEFDLDLNEVVDTLGNSRDQQVCIRYFKERTVCTRRTCVPHQSTYESAVN